MKETVVLDLQELFKVLLKRVWIIVLCGALVGAATLVYTMNFITPQYEASVTMYVNNNSTQEGTYIASGDLAAALRLVATYVNIIESDTVLEKVIEESGKNLSASKVRKMISAEAMGETEMFKVRVRTSDPQLSADIANALAKVAPGEISKIIESSSAKVVDYAKVPTGRSSPSYTVNTMLGIIVGAALAIIGIVLHNVLDFRVKNEDDLARICTVPVLGVIPDLDSNIKKNGKKGRL